MATENKPLSGRRICVLTSGHLATSPRMVKAADAFAEAGASVHVISTRSTPWADSADGNVRVRRPGAWTWETVDYRRESLSTYALSGARQRSALLLARVLGASRMPIGIAAGARERVFREIARRASKQKVDFVYGGGVGLAAAMFAAGKLGVPFGVDLEDFHTGDQPDTPEGRLFHDLSARIEREVLPAAALRTAGSEEIAQAYRHKYDLTFVTVNNAFSVVDPSDSVTIGSEPLRLYWFSQTIGEGRGLEDAVAAVGEAGISAELHLQGVAAGSYVQSLVKLARDVAPSLRVIEHSPCFPDDVVAESARYDVGLSLERTAILNRDLCLTNKALAYVAAGLALVMTDTAGQRRLAADLGEGAFLYVPADVTSFAEKLAEWSRDRGAHARAKAATLAAARRRWNWDHAEEKEKLVGAVAEVLPASAE